MTYSRAPTFLLSYILSLSSLVTLGSMVEKPLSVLSSPVNQATRRRAFTGLVGISGRVAWLGLELLVADPVLHLGLSVPPQ